MARGMFLLVLAFVSFSCVKNKKKDLGYEDYDAQWAGQVINSRVAVSDFLDANGDNNNLSILVEGDDIILSYADSIDANLSSEYYKLQDASRSKAFKADVIGIPIVNPVAGIPFGPVSLDLGYQLSDFPLDFNDVPISSAEIKEIDVENGELSVLLVNTFSHPIKVVLELESIQDKSGNVLVINVDVKADDSVEKIINLSQYTINLKDPSSGALNSFYGEARVSGVTTASPVLATNSLQITSTMRNLSYNYVKGKLGTFSIPISSGNNTISLFDDFDKATDINIETFKIRSTADLDWGIPLGLSLSQMDFINSTSNDTVGDIDGLDDLIKVNALENVNLVGIESVKNVFEWTSEDFPKLKDVFRLQPNEFNHTVQLTANPDNIDDEDMFISRNSSISSKLEGLFYLHGYLRDYNSADTIPLSLDVDLATFNNVSLRFILDNGLPVEYQMDIIFIDDEGNSVEQIIDQVVVEGAEVDSDGTVVARKYNLKDIPLTKEQIDNIMGSVENVVLISRLNTTDADQDKNVRISPDNDAHTIIGFKIGVNIDLDQELGGE